VVCPYVLAYTELAREDRELQRSENVIQQTERWSLPQIALCCVVCVK